MRWGPAQLQGDVGMVEGSAQREISGHCLFPGRERECVIGSVLSLQGAPLPHSLHWRHRPGLHQRSLPALLGCVCGDGTPAVPLKPCCVSRKRRLPAGPGTTHVRLVT